MIAVAMSTFSAMENDSRLSTATPVIPAMVKQDRLATVDESSFQVAIFNQLNQKGSSPSEETVGRQPGVPAVE